MPGPAPAVVQSQLGKARGAPGNQDDCWWGWGVPFGASPPLSFSYASGSLDIDITTEPVDRAMTERPCNLKDLWRPQDVGAGPSRVVDSICQECYASGVIRFAGVYST